MIVFIVLIVLFATTNLVPYVIFCFKFFFKEIVNLCFVSINNVWNFSLIRIRKLFEQLLSCSYSYRYLVICLNIQHNLEEVFQTCKLHCKMNLIEIALCQHLEQYHRKYICHLFPLFSWLLTIYSHRLARLCTLTDCCQSIFFLPLWTV